MRIITLAGLLLSVATAGCTATGAGLEMALDLPEQMSLTPSFLDRANAGEAAAQQAPFQTAQGETKSEQPYVVVAYSGPQLTNAAQTNALPVAKLVSSITPPPSVPGNLDTLIVKYALAYEVPVDLVRRVVKRESNFRPSAYNRGHWGLMQIKHATARGMGYQGPANGLLDAETNLKYAVKYLRGAYMVANGDHNRADRLYQTGYYYDAKRAGLLDETGLGRDRVRRRAG